MKPKTLTKSDLATVTGTEQIYCHGLVRHIVDPTASTTPQQRANPTG